MPMIENISFTLEGLKDYIHWQTEDKKVEIFSCKDHYDD